MKKIIDYRAERCPSCKAFIPMLEVFCSTNGIELVKINVEETEDLPDDLRSIPRIDLYQDGKFVKSHVGVLNEEGLLEFLTDDIGEKNGNEASRL